MFKLFKKYAVLDAVETDHYESYCMREQVAGGYGGSLYDAERDLLTTYYKALVCCCGRASYFLCSKPRETWC